MLHITHWSRWLAARAAGAYRDPSLETEGFIHCSFPDQLLGPANAFYQGQTGLCLLCIDPARVRAQVVIEESDVAGEAFPHIYGALNLDAVTAVVDFPPELDGSFALPQLPEA